MAYLGNTPTTQSFISGTDYFNGTGSQTAFTLTRTVNSVNDIEVVVNNVIQQPSSYTVSGTTLTLSAAPSAGTSNVYARYLSTTTQVITPSQNTVGWNQLTTDVQQDLGISFKNRIINGNFYVAQRATSATITAAAALNYATVDRFYGYCTGANVTMAQVSGSGSNRNLLQFTGAASVTAIGVGQRIESLNSYDLAGQMATLSVSIANSLLTTVTWTAYYANTTDAFGTLASPTRTQISTGTFTVNSTLTRYSTQISIPSAATTGIEIVFTVGAQTSGTWQLGQIQLELGTQATTFDYRSYGTELALCQRYTYGISTATGSQASANFGVAPNSTVARIVYQHPVTMRTSPSFTLSGTAGNFVVADGASSTAATSFALAGANPNFAALNVGATGLTAFRPYTLEISSTSAILIFSAEL